MSELLLELFSEEIPARMQAKAAEDLKAMITNGLVDAGLTYEGAQVHVTPRRLVLSVEGLQARAANTVEERKGPRVDAPKPAIDGFLKSTGLTLEQLTKQDDKKGQFYMALIKREGRAATDVIASLVPKVIREFPWPKSMRWGSGTLRWVRPLQSILCTFDGEVVPFDVDGIQSGNTTRGHRFLSKGVITAKRFEDYESKLRKAHVIVDAAARLETIRTEAKNLAFAQGLDMIEDEALLKEVAGLVEWPVVLMGEFDKAYLTVPPEVIITTIKVNQKCFCLKGKDGKLANKYLLVANIVPSDGGTEIIRGNNKVIAARLSDAKFFWDQDKKTVLGKKAQELFKIVFQKDLGSQGQRALRIEALAEQIAVLMGANEQEAEFAKLAGFRAKADLVSGLVNEFPELQGIVGGHLAEEQIDEKKFAHAIRDHYRPQGPTDSIPNDIVGQSVALADKLDTLIGMWAIGEKPTGSRDPFALRRASIGVIRILLEANRRLKLGRIIKSHVLSYETIFVPFSKSDSRKKIYDYFVARDGAGLGVQLSDMADVLEGYSKAHSKHLDEKLDTWLSVGVPSLLSFFADRLKVYLKDQGARHDLIDAVFSLGGQDDLLMVVRRVEALSKFLDSDDGKNLLVGYKRAVNILRAEEKKDATTYSGKVDDLYIVKAEERELKRVVEAAAALTKKAVDAEDFEGAMRAISKLRAPVDAFFEHVTVNDTDLERRANRLRLLNRIREAMAEVADFSKIEG